MNYTTASSRTSDEDAIRSVERRYDAAWTAGDVDRVLAVLMPDAVIVTPYGQTLSGLAEIEAVFTALLSGDFSKTTHTSTIEAVRFVTPDVAIVDANATIEGGEEGAIPFVHRFSDVLVKRDGAWRISQVRAYVFTEPKS